ncbi:MAG: discoidin domain-containing protein [Elusimicrobiota bacterium]
MKFRKSAVLSSIICLSVFLGGMAAAEEGIKPVSVKASSFEKGLKPENTIDNNDGTRWGSVFADPQWIMYDLGKETAVQKIFISWEDAHAKTYQLQASNDAKNWRILYYTDDCRGGKETPAFNAVKARYIRIFGIARKTNWGYSIKEVKIFTSSDKPAELSSFDEFSAASILKLAQESPKTYYSLVTGLSQAKYYPLYMDKKQGYYTVVGTEKGFGESAVCEDGTIDAGSKKFSVIPYVYSEGELIAVTDLKPEYSLEDGYLPIPIIKGNYKGVDFTQKVFDYENGGRDGAIIWYKLINKGKKAVSGKFFMTVRPFEVNPYWQSGGLVDVFSIESDSAKNITVNSRDLLCCSENFNNFAAFSYQEGDIIDFLKKGQLIPKMKNAYDPLGGASGALEYALEIPAGGEKEFFFAIPFGNPPVPVNITPSAAVKYFEIAKARWKEKLNRIKISLPDKKPFDVFRSNIAYILINRDGPAVQGGSRNYERVWMRDGAEIGVALLRAGFKDDVRDYIDWVSDRAILHNGEALGMINADGSAWDWGKVLNEYDGQGCYIFLVSEYYRFTKDKEFLKSKFPYIIKAAKFIKTLRGQEMRDELKNGSAEKKRFYGILPISVSHEGYVAPGQHSYWDDFWALRGLKDAREMALVLGETENAKWLGDEEKDLRKCLLDSIKYAQEFAKIDFIPGCADLGDFDPCSLAISAWPTEESQYLPDSALLKTMDRWYDEVYLPVRMDGKKKVDLLPYEMRMANAYLMLDMKPKTLAMFNYYLPLVRPYGWNHWGEVVYNDYREPKYVGDMPHSWVGGIFVNFLRNMFAYERYGKLVLGAGIDEKWLEKGDEISAENLPTSFGTVTLKIKKQGKTLKVSVTGDAKPENGFVFKSPFLKGKISGVALNGAKTDKFTGSEVTFSQLPAEIVINY